MMFDLEGKWDLDARSLTWTAPSREGKALTFQQRFASDDTTEQTILVKDDAGKVLYREDGKNTRIGNSTGDRAIQEIIERWNLAGNADILSQVSEKLAERCLTSSQTT